MNFDAVRQDIAYAFRTLRKNPAFAATALAALAIGIGANSAVFSVVNAVLLKPLTYPDAGRIVLFLLTTPAGPSYGASATKFNVLRRQSGAFDDVTAYEYNGAQLNLTGGAFPEQVHGIRVSANYFHLLGAPIVQGRAFTADEDGQRPGQRGLVERRTFVRGGCDQAQAKLAHPVESTHQLSLDDGQSEN